MLRSVVSFALYFILSDDTRFPCSFKIQNKHSKIMDGKVSRLKKNWNFGSFLRRRIIYLKFLCYTSDPGRRSFQSNEYSIWQQWTIRSYKLEHRYCNMVGGCQKSYIVKSLPVFLRVTLPKLGSRSGSTAIILNKYYHKNTGILQATVWQNLILAVDWQ